MAKAKKNIAKYVPAEIIVSKIFVIKEQKVMLDYDVAFLYGVTTKRMNEQVKRNIEKFSQEFMFRLTKKEWFSMRSQIATASQSKRNINITPYAFTEHGVAMVATVLKSDRAVKMSIAIIKTFIQLRKQILDYDSLAKQIKMLKLHLDGHDAQLNQIYDAIEDLLDKKADEKKWEERERIGFKK
ncbi:MAG: ORF6N domain-containing protein [Sphingobacteriales bacterium]|nr:ORF6N domain-containing protein [Sphingobacteriales bacterium]